MKKERPRREIVNAEGAVEGNLFLGEVPTMPEDGIGRRMTPPRTGWSSHIEELGEQTDSEIGWPHPDQPELAP